MPRALYSKAWRGQSTEGRTGLRGDFRNFIAWRRNEKDGDNHQDRPHCGNTRAQGFRVSLVRGLRQAKPDGAIGRSSNHRSGKLAHCLPMGRSRKSSLL